MCGIFGQSARKGKSINLLKLKILGLFNEQRGTDSCGFYHSGSINKGIGVDAKFSNFIANNKLTPGTLKTKLFIGHTRNKTCGQADYEGAHPHIINNNYVQTHNGTIKNIWALCSKHKVNQTDIFVDSIGLARLIEAIGPKTALEEYQGYAALAFTYIDNPEALYLYHGASKEKTDGGLMSERPLWILYQPEGIYYSSMRESLDAINVSQNTDDGPLPLNHNVVFEIINGEFTNNKLVIERENNNIPWVSTTVSKPTSQYKPPPLQLPAADESNDNDIITEESLPPTYTERRVGHIYFHKGKYYELCNFKNVHTHVVQVYGTIIDGEFVINRDGLITKNLLPGYREDKYYFIDGIMLKSKADYEFVKQNKSPVVSKIYFRSLLSCRSKYPIIQIKYPNGTGDNIWYHNGERVKRYAFKPKFSNRNYKIEYGRTKQILTESFSHDIIKGIQEKLFGSGQIY